MHHHHQESVTIITPAERFWNDVVAWWRREDQSPPQGDQRRVPQRLGVLKPKEAHKFLAEFDSELVEKVNRLVTFSGCSICESVTVFSRAPWLTVREAAEDVKDLF